LLHAMRPLPDFPPDWQTDWDGAPLDLPGGGRLLLQPGVPLAGHLRVRYRRGGEHLKPAGGAHTRELRTLLQEAGIPPWQRERTPLIYDGAELLAVGDLFLSEAGTQWCAARGTRFVRVH